MIAKRSPPGPFMAGSANPRKALAAMAASTALPPAFRISRATWVARGWLVAAIPFLAITSERVAKRWPESRSWAAAFRSEEHTSELQSRGHLVCRLLLEKK